MNTKKKYLSIRTRFAHDIVAEVFFPERQTGRVAILAIGAPSGSSKKERLQFLVSQGYVAVYPRYRGTWESDGWFLEHSPAKDIQDVVLELEKKKFVTDIATGKTFSVKINAVHLFGGSFGGPAVLLNTHLPIVKKVIAYSPVIDWSVEGEDEPFDEFVQYACLGYGGAYRPKHKSDWQKLVETDFYNPIAHVNEIDGKKVLILHAKDDTNVPCSPVVPFAEKIGASYYLKPHGGHRIKFEHGFLWKKVVAFLKKK
ncbi:MAG: prolyl oligopeptidase family serine peptidase [Candidatus Moranbacteria bacterium]|nr:prolyl oligopeptidase family serine peptidase [Candidatus Moranbacteria bacterium]